jgi:hypothetical protein
MTTWLRLHRRATCGCCGQPIPTDTVCLAITITGVAGHRLRCASCAAADYGPAPELVDAPPVPDPRLPREPPAWVRVNELRVPSSIAETIADYRRRAAGDA